MPNWGALGQNDNALAYFQLGTQMGEGLKRRQQERETKSALANALANPDDPKARTGLIQANPELGLQFMDRQAGLAQKQAAAAEAQRKAQGEQTQQVAAILRQVKTDPSRYPMARQAAIQMGIPAASIPEQYDPQWVAQQDMIFTAFEKDGGESVTSAMKHTKALGYDLNTPEGKAVLAQIVNGNSAKPYVDEQGRTRLYTGFNVQPAGAIPSMAPQAAPQGGAAPQAGQQAFTPEQFRGLVSGLGKDGAANYLRKNAMPVQIANASDYEMLPVGASYIDPNGVSRVKGQ